MGGGALGRVWRSGETTESAKRRESMGAFAPWCSAAIENENWASVGTFLAASTCLGQVGGSHGAAAR
jgi:hypothetical protein